MYISVAYNQSEHIIHRIISNIYSMTLRTSASLVPDAHEPYTAVWYRTKGLRGHKHCESLTSVSLIDRRAHAAAATLAFPLRLTRIQSPIADATAASADQ